MAVEDKHISYRVYLVAFGILVAIAIAVKLTNIQWVEGDYYRKLAKERTVKILLSPNKGNIYSSDGSLLATSILIMKYVLMPKLETFEKNVQALSDSLRLFWTNQVVLSA
jgi:cell division protein FtsI (penicillin-binding protein 3)